MRKILFTTLFLMLAGSLFAQEKNEFLVIEPVDYKAQINQEKVQLVDVRTLGEYAEGHIEGAENIDFKADGFLAEFSKFDRNEPLYIYCRSGNRSGKAAKMLSEIGFEKIIDLKGGFLSWQEFIKAE